MWRSKLGSTLLARGLTSIHRRSLTIRAAKIKRYKHTWNVGRDQRPPDDIIEGMVARESTTATLTTQPLISIGSYNYLINSPTLRAVECRNSAVRHRPVPARSNHLKTGVSNVSSKIISRLLSRRRYVMKLFDPGDPDQDNEINLSNYYIVTDS
ncbi:hypothetical protein EVAR_2585_1 [Eumeta japonica]|uniref:Uncharacterized protein n=1 Tax=Eumeta variegata TaxID=151549 RepID=A0A4C1SMI6_EUMVA|nr:hypothetical protein EVAR_2585_1 [Eumeta japonica]